MKSTDPVIVSTAQLAAILNLSARRVQQLREEGMPRATHGKWDLMSAIPWYIEHLEKNARPQDKTSEEAQRRYYLARAGLTEHKEAEAKGSAVSLAEHRAVVSELCADLAMEIEAFPVREYTQPDERDTAFRICHRLREQLAVAVSEKRQDDSEDDSEPAAGTPPDTQRESMGRAVSDAATT